MTIRTMAVALLLAAFTLVGCNTTAGLGRDIEAAGEEIRRNQGSVEGLARIPVRRSAIAGQRVPAPAESA